MTTLKQRLYFILGGIVILWVIELINQSMGHQLNVWGVFPRSISGLKGIFFWPFLHGNINHLLVNTIPVIVLGWFVVSRGRMTLVGVTLSITLLGGLCIWLFGRPSFHIGASGLVFGYFGFLVACAIFERSLSSIFIAVVTLFLYGGIIWGVLPSESFISWEAHLFGLLSGILAARFQSKVGSGVSYSNN